MTISVINLAQFQCSSHTIDDFNVTGNLSGRQICEIPMNWLGEGNTDHLATAPSHSQQYKIVVLTLVLCIHTLHTKPYVIQKPHKQGRKNKGLQHCHNFLMAVGTYSLITIA
jgi:hypothetical protein